MTTLKLLLDNHPSFTAADEVESLCKPLEQLEIYHFSHVQVNADGHFAFLSNNQAFTKHYLEREYYHFDVIQLNTASQEEYFILDLQNTIGKTRQLQDDFNAFGFGHSFTILQNSAIQRDFYNFATYFGNGHINEYYLQKLNLLKQFICFFHEKVEVNNHLKQAYEYKLPLKCERSGFQQHVSQELIRIQRLNIGPVSRYYLPGTQSYLTHREHECLSWIAKGKTQDETAVLLNVSLRTVRAHITQVKEKLQCYNQFQLGMYFSKLVPFT